METNTLSLTWSHPIVVDFVRTTRNYLIKDFLEEYYLTEHIKESYSSTKISKTKISSIVNELNALLATPVDLAHYGSLISRLKAKGPSSFSVFDKQLFYMEIAKMIDKHVTN